MTTKTATEYRADAAASFKAEHDSFERCDTDGFASQAASNLSGRKNMRNAEIADNGGKAEFNALFDLDGNLVNAKVIRGNYGLCWALLDGDTYGEGRIVGKFIGAFPKRLSTMSKKGYYEGTVRRDAYATIAGGGKGLAGMASCFIKDVAVAGSEVEIVDNGIEDSA